MVYRSCSNGSNDVDNTFIKIMEVKTVIKNGINLHELELNELE